MTDNRRWIQFNVNKPSRFIPSYRARSHWISLLNEKNQMINFEDSAQQNISPFNNFWRPIRDTSGSIQINPRSQPSPKALDSNHDSQQPPEDGQWIKPKCILLSQAVTRSLIPRWSVADHTRICDCDKVYLPHTSCLQSVHEMLKWGHNKRQTSQQTGQATWLIAKSGFRSQSDGLMFRMRHDLTAADFWKTSMTTWRRNEKQLAYHWLGGRKVKANYRW